MKFRNLAKFIIYDGYMETMINNLTQGVMYMTTDQPEPSYIFEYIINNEKYITFYYDTLDQELAVDQWYSGRLLSHTTKIYAQKAIKRMIYRYRDTYIAGKYLKKIINYVDGRVSTVTYTDELFDDMHCNTYKKQYYYKNGIRDYCEVTTTGHYIIK